MSKIHFFLYAFLVTAIIVTSPAHATNGNLKPAHVQSWAEKAVIETFSFGHNFHERQLQYASDYFTPEGWEKFSDALAKSRIIESIKMNEQDVISEIGDFQETSIQWLEDKGQWHVQIPIHTSFKTYRRGYTQKYIVNVYIIETDKGSDEQMNLGIVQWIAIPYSK